MVRFLRQCEEYCHQLAERRLPRCAPFLRRHARVWRYLVAGGAAAVADFAALYGFTDGLGLHYLVSAAVAFVVAFGVSFTLQKFWTFQDHSTDRIHVQGVLYFALAVANLLFNTVLMYLFVDGFGFWYMAAQFLASGLIACESFLLYKVIFRRPEVASPSAR